MAAHGVAMQARDVLDCDHLRPPGRQTIQQRRQHLGRHRAAHLGQVGRAHHQHLIERPRGRPLQLVGMEDGTIGLRGGGTHQSKGDA